MITTSLAPHPFDRTEVERVALRSPTRPATLVFAHRQSFEGNRPSRWRVVHRTYLRHNEVEHIWPRSVGPRG